MNVLNKNGKKHSSEVFYSIPEITHQAIFIEDVLNFLKKMPDKSVQLILIDPPYNLDMAIWDTFNNYMDWAKQWLSEAERILSDNGNLVIFGGYQYQNGKVGDLLEIMYHLKHNSKLMFVNLIIWYYKSGMGAHRFFSNRHEDIVWFAKSKKYYFNLDSVRMPFDDATKKAYMKDKRLNPKSIEKGKNPTNVWEIPRLNATSKERVGHPTQKPIEVIRRIVRSLSYPNSLVLDFFAGSGTTGRVCIEERRHCIMVDNDKKTPEYFKEHIKKMNNLNKYFNEFEVSINPNLEDFLNDVKTS
jgi:site-specific DNA-methyltransferase (adenine-specific)